MKIDFKQMIVVGFMWLLAFVLLMWVFSLQSCSSSYHLNKFYKKGGKIEDKKVEVTIHDTIHINGRDSIIEKSILVDCPEPKAPLTRYEIRYKYKTLHDSILVEKWKTKYIYKERIKTLKTEVKTNPLRNLKSFIFWGVFIVILLFVYNWISKR